MSATERPWYAVPVRAAVWLAAAMCAGSAPALFFLAGTGPDAATAERLIFPTVAYALEWVLLRTVLALSLRGRAQPPSVSRRVAARRATLLVCYSAAVSILGFGLGSGGSFSGDTAWALFWSAAAIGGAWLVAVAVRRRPDPTREHRRLPLLAVAAVMATVPVDVSGLDECNEYAGTVPLAAIPYEVVVGPPPPPLVYVMSMTERACAPEL